MATIKLVEENDASQEVRQVYQEIKQHFGLDFVPSIFKALAHEPDNLKLQWEGYKQTEQVFGKETLLLLGLAVDITNACTYCTEFDTAMLKQLGYDDAKIEGVVNFISANSYFNRYVQGLDLEPDVTSATVGRKMATV